LVTIMTPQKNNMLAFNVAQLLKEGIGATRRHELAGELHAIDEHNAGPVSVQGHVQLIVTPEGVLAMGEAEFSLVTACPRCLTLTESRVTVEIEEEFYPVIDIVSGRPMPDDHDDEPELLIDEHHILDLSEVLKQYAVAQTLKPAVCKPDCAGLCPVCGENRNIVSCSCETREMDPRLAALAQLLEESETEE
jgi:uncharacterized protein